jgi:hypothetical protein
LSAPWIVALDDRGHDPSGLLVEVDDHPHPAALIQMLSVEALAAWPWIEFPMVGMAYGCEDCGNVSEQLVPAAVFEMEV